MTTAPLRAVFEYLADSRSLAQWDPYTQSMRRISGDGEVGSRYANISRYRILRMPMTYRTVVLDPDVRYRSEGDNRVVHTVDDFRLRSVAGGIHVDYHAEFTVKVVSRFADPVLGRVVSAAADNIIETLATRLDQLTDS
jgi:hypothetical protein